MNRKNKRYLLVSILGAVILLVLGYFIGQKDYVNVSAQGNLELVEDYFDFGTVGLDPVEHSFVIKNTGDGPVIIEKISTSCGCTTAQLKKSGDISQPFGMDHGNLPKANFTLEAGEQAEVLVSYNPLAHGLKNARGVFRRMVYIRTDNPRGEYSLTIDVKVDPDKQAEKNPEIEADNISYDFGKVTRAGGVVETKFKISNAGGGDLVVNNISTSCGCTTADLSSHTIKAGESVDLVVKFDPDFHKEPQGKLERSVTLFTNDPQNPEFNVKIYAEIID